MNLEEKVVSEKLIYKGNYLDIVNVDVVLPNGKPSNKDIVKHPGAVAVIAFVDEENIILIEQFRLPVNDTILEIPAGKLNKGEDITEGAKRELQEETGYIAGNIEYLGKIATAPGYCDEIIYMFKATDLTLGETNEDEDEFINVNIININELKKMIKCGDIIDTKTISILAYL